MQEHLLQTFIYCTNNQTVELLEHEVEEERNADIASSSYCKNSSKWSKKRTEGYQINKTWNHYVGYKQPSDRELEVFLWDIKEMKTDPCLMGSLGCHFPKRDLLLKGFARFREGDANNKVLEKRRT